MSGRFKSLWIPVELSILAGSSVSFGEAQMSPMYCGLVKTTKKTGDPRSWRVDEVEAQNPPNEKTWPKRSGFFWHISIFLHKIRYSGTICGYVRRPLPASEFWHGYRSCLRLQASLSRGVTKMDPTKILDRKLTSKWVKNQRSLKFKKAEFVQKSHHQCWRKLCKTKHYMLIFCPFFEVEVHWPPRTREHARFHDKHGRCKIAKEFSLQNSVHLPQSNLVTLQWSWKVDRYIINLPAERCPLPSYNQCIMKRDLIRSDFLF